MSHPAFELVRERRIASLNVEAREYRHRDTGARHLHLAAEDNNNCFSVAFRTVPGDSSGVAHILEHTTLCGSRRFPVRDPFFLMMRRSLNTFMNAFTGADWTAYPFASQCPKDFYNLMQVYLDAVFFPRLDPRDFAQEGHRVEFQVADDPSSELVYKGVVYNEMKGAMSSPHARLWQSLCAELFPATAYRHNSGGEPSAIPALSYSALKAFHSKHYHPTNAFFTTFGDLPEAEHQAQMHQWALSQFSARETVTGVQAQARFDAPRSTSVTYADAGETPRRTHIVVGWVLGNTTDLAELIEMHLLAGLLLDNSASPLQHALETTPLGSSPSELNGLGVELNEATFVCGVEGSEPRHAEALERLILEIIEGIVRDGVETPLIDSVLHQLELEQREIPTGTYPYGLRLTEAATACALHGGDPIAALDIDPLLTELGRRVKSPGYIQDLARRLLLDNPHRVRLIMAPDPKLSLRQLQQERDSLVTLRAGMDDAAATRLLDSTAALARHQHSADDPELLPKVGLEDVATEIRYPRPEQDRVAEVPLSWFDAATNGLVYQHILIELPSLNADEMSLLGIYSDCLADVGIGDQDYLQVQTRQAKVSGGVGAHCSVTGRVDDYLRVHAYLWIEGSGLARNHQGLTELLYDTFQSARFDEADRLRELIAQHRATKEASITEQGHLLAVAAACAGINPPVE